MWKSNESVTSVKNSNVFVKPVKNSYEIFTYVTNTCKPFTYVKDSHDFFTSVIRTHDMCDKVIKKSICNAFMFTAAYLPKHNTVLWKEKCWGDIRLFLRRLGLGRTTRKIKDGRRRPYLSMDRNSVRYLHNSVDNEGNILTKFKKYPTGGLGGGAITRNVYRRTIGRRVGGRRVPRP